MSQNWISAIASIHQEEVGAFLPVSVSILLAVHEKLI
jgi:hypothetical protein